MSILVAVHYGMRFSVVMYGQIALKPAGEQIDMPILSCDVQYIEGACQCNLFEIFVESERRDRHA